MENFRKEKNQEIDIREQKMIEKIETFKTSCFKGEYLSNKNLDENSKNGQELAVEILRELCETPEDFELEINPDVTENEMDFVKTLSDKYQAKFSITLSENLEELCFVIEPKYSDEEDDIWHVNMRVYVSKKDGTLYSKEYLCKGETEKICNDVLELAEKLKARIDCKQQN